MTTEPQPEPGGVILTAREVMTLMYLLDNPNTWQDDAARVLQESVTAFPDTEAGRRNARLRVTQIGSKAKSKLRMATSRGPFTDAIRRLSEERRRA